MRRPLRCGKNFLQFYRHVQYDHVVHVGLEILNVGPEADQKENISNLQPFLQQVVHDHFVAVPQPDDGEAVFGANPGLEHGLADQRGFGRQDDLRRADLLRAVDKIVSDLAERPRLELQGLPQLVDAVVRDVHIGEQYIVCLQFRLRGWTEHLGRKPRPTLDGEKVHARRAKRQFVEALSDKRRASAYAAALFAIGEAVLLDPPLKARAAVRRSRQASLGGQQAAREKHIDDAEGEYRQSERGKAEKTKSLRTLSDQFGIHHQIGRRRHQCQHSADQRGETQRHHKPAWLRAAILRDAQHHRDENGDNSG